MPTGVKTHTKKSLENRIEQNSVLMPKVYQHDANIGATHNDPLEIPNHIKSMLEQIINFDDFYCRRDQKEHFKMPKGVKTHTKKSLEKRIEKTSALMSKLYQHDANIGATYKQQSMQQTAAKHVANIMKG